MLSPALSAALAANRESFNARFAEAKRDHPGLSIEDFSSYLASTADAIVSSISAIHPERIAAISSALFDIGLQLVGQALAGPGARIGGVEECLPRLASAFPDFIAEDPERSLASIANAAVKLAALSPGMPSAWCSRLIASAQACRNVEELLQLGGIAAWLCGMSHYREGALQLLAGLPERLTRSALGLDDRADGQAIVSKLKADPWFRPAGTGSRQTGAKTGAPLRVGSFRGFGGVFVEPPRVAADGENIYVASGDGAWALFADAFGTTLHSVPSGEYLRAESRPQAQRYVGEEASRIMLPGKTVELGAPGILTSIALTKATIACTTDLSHAILVVPLTLGLQ
jgi:hypothetical protein